MPAGQPPSERTAIVAGKAVAPTAGSRLRLAKGKNKTAAWCKPPPGPQAGEPGAVVHFFSTYFGGHSGCVTSHKMTGGSIRRPRGSG